MCKSNKKRGTDVKRVVQYVNMCKSNKKRSVCVRCSLSSRYIL